MNVKGDCLANGGPHWMIAETAYYAGEKGKHGKSWHPSAGMHLLRGEVLAYNFLHILADAIYMIEEDLEKNKLSKEDAFLSKLLSSAIICYITHMLFILISFGLMNQSIAKNTYNYVIRFLSARCISQ
jgi:hypothetical protein